MSYKQTFLHIKNQLPVHFQDNYDLFIKFMEYYYQYLGDAVFNRDLENLRNIEKTSADLYKFILSEYSMLPNMDFSEFDFFTSMKHFYRKKGTSDSFKHLFEQLYNEKIDISYPADRTFSLSEGEWIQNKSFFVKLTNDNTLPIQKLDLLNGQKINLISGNNIYSVFVESAKPTFSFDYESKEKTYSSSFVEIFYTNTNKIQINLDDILISNIGDYIFKASAIDVVSKYTILNGGRNFKKGEILNCEYKDDNTLLFKVMDVDEHGTILALDILNSSPYIDNDVIIDLKHVNQRANDLNSNMNKLTISYNKQRKTWYVEFSEMFSDVETFKERGKLYRRPEGKNTPFGFLEQDFLNMDDGVMYDDEKPDHYNKKDLKNIIRYFPVNEIEPTFNQYEYDLNKPSSIKESFYNNDYDLELGKYNFFKDTTNYNARIKLFTTNVIKKKGYYNNNKSFLSDTIYLAGGNYYHSDSYVIHSEHSISEWHGIVKNTIHPSGSAMFSEFLYNIFLNVNPDIQSSLDIKDLWINIIDEMKLYRKTELIYDMHLHNLNDAINHNESILHDIIKVIVENIKLPEKIAKDSTKDIIDAIYNVEKLLRDTNKRIRKDKINIDDTMITNAIDYVKKIISDTINYSEKLDSLITVYLKEIEPITDNFYIISNRKITISEKITIPADEEILDITNGMYYIISVSDKYDLYSGGYIEPYTVATADAIKFNDNTTWETWIKIFGDEEIRKIVSNELNNKNFLLNVEESENSYGVGIGIIN